MYRDNSVLGIIPARGGSKGLPRKNILPLLGKPLIAWTIEQAKASKYIDRVIVTTDDEEIAEISRRCGAEVPFVRPSHLAADTTSPVDVISHTLSFFEDIGTYFDYFAYLEPTSPLRDTEDIDSAFQMLISNQEAESIVGVSKVESTHPCFLVRLEKGFLISYLNGQIEIKRRQDLDALYFFEGSLYISKTESFKSRKTYYHDKALGYIVPKWKSFEIDDYSDFIIIEALLKAKQEQKLPV